MPHAAINHLIMRSSHNATATCGCTIAGLAECGLQRIFHFMKLVPLYRAQWRLGNSYSIVFLNNSILKQFSSMPLRSAGEKRDAL